MARIVGQRAAQVVRHPGDQLAPATAPSAVPAGAQSLEPLGQRRPAPRRRRRQLGGAGSPRGGSRCRRVAASVVAATPGAVADARASSQLRLRRCDAAAQLEAAPTPTDPATMSTTARASRSWLGQEHRPAGGGSADRRCADRHQRHDHGLATDRRVAHPLEDGEAEPAQPRVPRPTPTPPGRRRRRPSPRAGRTARTPAPPPTASGSRIRLTARTGSRRPTPCAGGGGRTGRPPSSRAAGARGR